MKIISVCMATTLFFSTALFAQIKVACVGNSITEGFGLSDPPHQCYPSKLQGLLGSGYTVQNDGLTAKMMLKSDPQQSYWKFGPLGRALDFKPNIVTIELGTNDVGKYAGTWNSVSAEFKADYLAMVDTFYALPTKPKVYPVLPLPRRDNNDSILVKANAIIKEVAQLRGLTVIDCHTPFAGKSQLYTDDLHPNAAGADTMAHIIYRALTNPVAILDDRPPAVGRVLVPDIDGSNFSCVKKAIANGGQFKIRVFDSRGALVVSEYIQSGSPTLDAIYSRLRSSTGISWISLKRVKL